MDLLAFEKKYWSKGIELIAGIDEAGRGPLAGPVVAAAVILPKNVELPQVTDSKKISEKKRDILFGEICNSAISIGIGIVHENEIDEINILQATYKAMRMAIGSLSKKPDILLVDGLKADIPHFEQENIIKGDNKSLSIAAASIIAKVTRDRMMRNYGIIFPKFNFSGHKGYASKGHIEEIEHNLATPIHRKSFKPIKHFLPTMRTIVDKQNLGKLGEQLVACKYVKNNYRILNMNYAVPQIGEIDIIAEDEESIVFIEVKTQLKGRGWGEPKSRIDDNKCKRFSNTIQNFMNEFDINKELRIDVAEVIIGGGKPQINIIENGMSQY